MRSANASRTIMSGITCASVNPFTITLRSASAAYVTGSTCANTCSTSGMVCTGKKTPDRNMIGIETSMPTAMYCSWLCVSTDSTIPTPVAPIENIAKTDFPPCICRIIEDMKNGEHIGHQARWALGVYLVRSGMKTEDVLAIYADSPEYNENTTKYQLEYIKGKEYSMPSCATMDTYGLSQNNCPCLVAGVRRGTPVTNSRRRTGNYEKTKIIESKTGDKTASGKNAQSGAGAKEGDKK